MRLFIIFIFLTFVVLEPNNAAPQSQPLKNSPLEDKSVSSLSSDDYIPTLATPDFKVQLGGISGQFGADDPKGWHYIVSVTKRQEYSFERIFHWGLSLTSNQYLELKLQTSLATLLGKNGIWENFGCGFSQFLVGRDGISNLVNINQTKINFYSDLGPYFQAQVFYGLKGLAYSLSFQSWF